MVGRVTLPTLVGAPANLQLVYRKGVSAEFKGAGLQGVDWRYNRPTIEWAELQADSR